MSEAPRAVVAGHGRLAEGLLSAVEQITGRGDRFLPFTNTDRTPDGVEEALRAVLDASGARIVFTDLPGGSCTMAARRLARSRPDLVVVTGVSLPVLLAFACGAPLEEAVAKGRDAVQLGGGARGP
jgi:N-acetylgalactosamine PTS system EIIA component